MNCSQELIEAYLDEELDPGLSASVKEHLSSCQPCSDLYSRFRVLRERIGSDAPYYTAPPRLQRSVREALHEAAAKEARPATSSTPWRWLAIAATVLLAISVSWNLRPAPSQTAATLLAENIVSDHIRSLIGTHLMDVPSTDQHTVKPWFNGKLDFSPEVRDFASQGFPLLGGRLDYLMDRPVAALVYGRRQHIINVFTWPAGSKSDRAEDRFSRNGYSATHWVRGSMTFWAVSDVAPSELAQFKRLYEN
jgi:anti-sigma factor RsiW